MASKRDLKKYFRDQSNQLADHLYGPLMSGDKSVMKKADELLDKTADVLDEFTNEISAYPKKNKAAVSKYFEDLKFRFDQELNKLKSEIEKV